MEKGDCKALLKWETMRTIYKIVEKVRKFFGRELNLCY